MRLRCVLYQLIRVRISLVRSPRHGRAVARRKKWSAYISIEPRTSVSWCYSHDTKISTSCQTHTHLSSTREHAMTDRRTCARNTSEGRKYSPGGARTEPRKRARQRVLTASCGPPRACPLSGAQGEAARPLSSERSGAVRRCCPDLLRRVDGEAEAAADHVENDRPSRRRS